LFYSGDVDIFTVPFAYTSTCLMELNDIPMTQFSPWFVNGATAGYWQQFAHHTFATVKGGGHELPLYQPLSSLNLFERILKNQTLTDYSNHKPSKPSSPILNQGMLLKQFGIKG